MYKDEEKKFDVRVVEKHIQKGTITKAQLNAYLKKLPDVSSNIDDEYNFDSFSARTKAKAGSPPSPPQEDIATRGDENES